MQKFPRFVRFSLSLSLSLRPPFVVSRSKFRLGASLVSRTCVRVQGGNVCIKEGNTHVNDSGCYWAGIQWRKLKSKANLSRHKLHRMESSISNYETRPRLYNLIRIGKKKKF